MASTSVSPPVQLLQALKITRGVLSIKMADSDLWTRLESPSGDNRFNCQSIVFDDGVTVSQYSKETRGICTVKFVVETPATIVQDKTQQQNPFSMEAKCSQIGLPEFDSEKVDDKAPGIENAKTFALANLDQATTFIKIDGLTRGNTNRKALTFEAISQQVAALLVREARGSAAIDAGVFLRELFDVSMAERDHQAEKTMKQTGCRVELLRNARGTQLELRAWPAVDPDARDADILTNDMPMRFAVEGHPLLTSDGLPTHPIVGQETDAWEITVIKSSAAPVVGIISNSFPGPLNMASFIGHASNVTLNPIIDDILGTRARKAVRELDMTSAEQEGLNAGEIIKYLDPDRSLSKLPLEKLFLVGKPVPEKTELAIEISLPLPGKWEQGLKDRQATGVEDSIMNKLFAIHGPPGTGKSHVASRIIWVLLTMFPGEKVLCSAPANVALESLMNRCIKECKALGMEELPFVLMEEASAAFCTTAGLASPALQWKAEGETKAWPASTWLLDEAGQANPDAVLLGLVTFALTLKRFTMFGDDLHLPPFKGSDLAKRVYKKSFLEQFVDRGFPFATLNHQFRALDVCMWPVNKVVYNGQLYSEFTRDNPGPLSSALILLQGMLPLPVVAGKRQYGITDLHNFVDVANGQHFAPQGGSSFGNNEEVEVVSALVKAFKDKGIKSRQICVLAVYRTQVKLLREEATRAQWQDCYIDTIDGSRGLEWDIVIISLVKTEGDTGFIERVGRACVGCSRHKIGLYLVGDWKHWGSRRHQGYFSMTYIIRQMKWTSGPFRDMRELVVTGKSVTPTTQPHQQPVSLRQSTPFSPQQTPPRQQPTSPRQQVVSPRQLISPSIQQTLSSPLPLQQLAPSPAPHSPKDDGKEEKQRQRDALIDRMQQCKIRRNKAADKKAKDLEVQRAAAIAELNAHYYSLKKDEIAGLPEQAEVKELEEALERLE